MRDCSAVKVSAIVPCYNGAAYLAECLDSILRLDSVADEVVVVDDGSSEPIRDLVERYQPRVKYIWQPNQGPGAARNTGIRHSSGRYIRFIDADDWLLSKTGLAAQVAVLDAHDDVGLVYGRALMVDRDGKPIEVHGPSFASASYVRSGHEELADLLFGNSYIPTSSTIVRRSVVEQIGGFRSDYRTAQDWECWLRIARVSNVAFIDQRVAVYRSHSEGVTGRKTFETWFRIHDEILSTLFGDSTFCAQFGHLRGPAYARLHIAAAIVAFGQRDRRRARRYALSALVKALRHRRPTYAAKASRLLVRGVTPPWLFDSLLALRKSLTDHSPMKLVIGAEHRAFQGTVGEKGA